MLAGYRQSERSLRKPEILKSLTWRRNYGAPSQDQPKAFAANDWHAVVPRPLAFAYFRRWSLVALYKCGV